MLEFVMLVGPGCAAAILYNILAGDKSNTSQLAVIAMGFAGVANLMTYAVIWLIGQPNLVWTFDTHLKNVYFCVQYMGTSLVFACLTALVAVGFESIVKAVRKK